jgi:phosphatidylserine decarboxylase
MTVSAIAAGLVVTALSTTVDMKPPLAGLVVAVVTLAALGSRPVVRFYPDPERSAPEREGAVVSPADGLVIYVRRSERGALPISTKRGRPYVLDELFRTPLRSNAALVMRIALRVLDVHLNRAPIAVR